MAKKQFQEVAGYQFHPISLNKEEWEILNYASDKEEFMKDLLTYW